MKSFLFVLSVSLAATSAFAQSDRGGRGVVEVGNLNGWQISSLCVTDGGHTLRTKDPVSMCVKQRLNPDPDGTCERYENKIISFNRDNAIFTCTQYNYPPGADAQPECFAGTYSPAPLSYTFPIVKYTERSNCSADANCWESTVVGQESYTIPECAR